MAAPIMAADFNDLLDAIEQVESGGNKNAVGDNGRAIGSFQLWKIYVDDVCRISGKKFCYADRLSREKSREMVKIYLEFYGKNKSFEAMARIHNGGPNGWRNPKTVKYWYKVKKLLENKKK
jgi:hypothetical protein